MSSAVFVFGVVEVRQPFVKKEIIFGNDISDFIVAKTENNKRVLEKETEIVISDISKLLEILC